MYYKFKKLLRRAQSKAKKIKKMCKNYKNIIPKKSFEARKNYCHYFSNL